MKEVIGELIQSSLQVKQSMLCDTQVDAIYKICQKIEQTYKNGAKTLICGNGGSASDALHFSAEIVCRFTKNRSALNCICLNSNVSSLTAIANDFGYEYVFSRQVEAYGEAGDTLIAISTSGNSKNVLKAIESAKKMGIGIISFTGENPKALKEVSDLLYCAPSSVTARIQECHALLIHIIAHFVEETLFGENVR